MICFRVVLGCSILFSQASATPVTATGCSSSGVPNSFYGFGVVNARAAVEKARTEQQPLVFTGSSPSIAVCGTAPTLTFTGTIVPSATSVIGFGAAGSCSSPVAVTPLTSSTVTIASAIVSSGTYVLCYSTNSGGFWSQQSVSLVVSCVSSISPSTIGTESRPSLTFAGSEPSPTTRIAFAPPGNCNTGRIAETLLPSVSSANLASSIPSPGVYALCYSVNSGSSWVEQSVSLNVVTATPTSISSVFPPSSVVGQPLTVRFNGAVPTPTSKVAFALPGTSCAARLSEVSLALSDIAIVGPLSIPGQFEVCYTVEDAARKRAGTWVLQSNIVFDVHLIGANE